MRPIVRRLITRMFAIVPALAVALGVGERGLNSLLILSQVVLSATLPFAVIPLVYFTNSREHMGEQAKRQFTNGRVLRVASWAIAVIVTMLNLYLLIAAIVL